MGTRVNLVLDDEVKLALDRMVPSGQRSEFANKAIQNQLVALKRRQALDRISKLRRQGPSVATSEVIHLLREAREGAS